MVVEGSVSEGSLCDTEGLCLVTVSEPAQLQWQVVAIWPCFETALQAGQLLEGVLHTDVPASCM